MPHHVPASRVATKPDASSPLQVFIFEHNTLGVFAQLTQFLLIATYCEEADIRPYFYVINTNLVDCRRGANWAEYFLRQHGIRPVDIPTIRRQITTGSAVRIRNRYDINSLARGGGLAELQNELGDVREAARLFHRHLRFRDGIVQEVDHFIAKAFGGSPFLGIHYRATDKFGTEAPLVHFDTMGRQIDAHRAGMPLFVATDSPEFLAFCRGRYGADVAHFTRPDGRSHLERQDRNYEKGREAILDCLTLSRSRTLIKTPSALSAWSKVLNDDLALVLVGEPLHAPWDETSLTGLGYWPECRLYDRDPEMVRANRILGFAAAETGSK